MGRSVSVGTDDADGVGVIQLYRTASTGHEIGVTFWQPVAAPAPTEVPAVTTLPTTAPS